MGSGTLERRDIQLMPTVFVFFLQVLFSLYPIRLEVSRAIRYLCCQQTVEDDMKNHPNLTTDLCISTW